MIKVDKLTIGFFGKVVLKDISFELPDRQNLVILGKSGSGKTVLIKSLLGINRPESGSILLDGVDIHRAEDDQVHTAKARFAMVFQNAALLDSFTIYQNVALPLYERGQLSEQDIEEKVDFCLDKVGLGHTKNMVPSELSGGMRKRIGIARALVYDPQYIIFDEPISGLDPITAKEIVYYIAQIASERKVSVITITHDIRDLDQIADLVLFINEGEVRFFGRIGELWQSQDPLIRDFLA